MAECESGDGDFKSAAIEAKAVGVYRDVFGEGYRDLPKLEARVAAFFARDGLVENAADHYGNAVWSVQAMPGAPPRISLP
jgi:hypothetical protein